MRRGSCEWTLKEGLRVCNHLQLNDLNKKLSDISSLKVNKWLSNTVILDISMDVTYSFFSKNR